MAEVPRHRLNRIQANGVAFMVVGVTFTMGIMILTSFYPIDPNRRAGMLGGSEGFIVAGAVMFLIGWYHRRRKSDDSSRE